MKVASLLSYAKADYISQATGFDVMGFLTITFLWLQTCCFVYRWGNFERMPIVDMHMQLWKTKTQELAGLL